LLAIKHNIKKFSKNLKRMGKEIDKGIISSLNKTNTTMSTRASRELAKITGLKQKEVKKGMSKKKATNDFLSSIFVRGKAKNVYSFAGRATKRGVRAKPWNNGKEFKGAFVLHGRAAMVRTSKNSKPLKPLFGPSLRNEFNKNVLTNDFKSHSKRRFKDLFYKEMEFRKKKVFRGISR
jgi:hypothetical protein